MHTAVLGIFQNVLLFFIIDFWPILWNERGFTSKTNVVPSLLITVYFYLGC